MNNQDNNVMQNDRLIEIEMKLAYQEDLLQSLNDIIVEQRKLLDLLELRMKKFTEQINNGRENIQFSETAEEELPPHY